MLNTFTFVLFALASGAGSVLALRGAWRGKSVASRMLALAGWMALIFSVLLWQQVYGIEFAVSYALAWFSLCAFVAVLLNRQYSAPRAAAELSLVTSGATSARHKWLTFLAAGPLGLFDPGNGATAACDDDQPNGDRRYRVPHPLGAGRVLGQCAR